MVHFAQVLALVGALLCVLPIYAKAQTDSDSAVILGLTEIKKFAEEFCGDYWQEGSSSSLQLDGAAEARFRGLLDKLVGLGIEGAAKFNSSEYAGLLRKDLAGELRNVRDCRLTIWSDLQDAIFIQNEASASLSTCSNNTFENEGTIIFNCYPNQSAFPEETLQNLIKNPTRPTNWVQQRQNDIIADFYGCIREARNSVLCSLEFTNDGTQRETIQVQVKDAFLIQSYGDRYPAEDVKIRGKRWNGSMAFAKVDPGRFLIFDVRFLVKPDSGEFDEFEVGFNSSIGSPHFIFLAE